MSKKLIAILLALSFVFAFAACSGNKEDETTTTTAAEEITEAPVDDVTEAPVDDVTEAPVEDPSAAGTSDVSEDPSAAVAETTVADAEMTKADFVKFLNAETAKAAKGSYKFSRTCSYTDPIDVGNATETLNKIIQGIDENSNLDTVVGGFLGIGTKTGTFPKDDLDDDYQLKATTLKEADLGSFSYKDGVYSFTLANAKEPQKNGATPISRFTNDFITHQEVADGVAEQAGSLIKVEETDVTYTNIKVSVKVEGGKIVSINYSYAFDAVLNLKLAVLNIEGSGAAVTKAEFSNLKY